MELAIGNDGLRLLLDDMSIKANGTTYNGDTIKSGIQSGNASYSHSGEWTQAEMDTIITYAASKHIEIIPLVNNPGHMDSILAAMSACGINGKYKTSKRTIDLENEKAVAFTQALVMKYAEYFASKGCKYFNIGADEYANDYHTDATTGMGFGAMVETDLYDTFAEYVNTLVEDICSLGMTPIAFNDGIYYNNTDPSKPFDTRLMVAAWTGGWSNIKPGKTDYISQKGHKILNTNERWYYVPSATGGYTYNNALNNAGSVSVTTVTDNTGVIPVGAMQCVWFDYPNVNYESYKSNILTLINTIAENNPDYFVPYQEPEVEDVTKTESDVSITAPGLTGLTVSETTAPAIEGASNVKAWSVVPSVASGNYTGEATVKIPVPAGWNTAKLGAFVVNADNSVTKISGTYADGYYTYVCPHFSTTGVFDVAEAAGEVDPDAQDSVTSKGTAATYVLDSNGIDSGSQYIIVYNGNALAYNGNSISSISVTENSDNTLTISNDVNISNIIWIRQASGMYNETYKRYLSIDQSSLSTSGSDNAF